MHKKETLLGYIVSLDNYIRSSPKEKEEFLQDIITESNLIEGITYNLEETRYEGLKEPERDGHYDAIKYLMENRHIKTVDTNDIKNMHKLLMTNLITNAGDYRRHPSHVGKRGTPHSRHINKLMNELEDKVSDNMSPDEVYDIHYMFETIHPFSDGNGRTGRLLLNWLTLRNFNEFHIITSDKRKEYFTAINNYSQKFKNEHPKVKFNKEHNQNIYKIRQTINNYEEQKEAQKHPFII